MAEILTPDPDVLEIIAPKIIDPFLAEATLTKQVNALVVPSSFKIHEVDGITSSKPNIQADLKKDLELAALDDAARRKGVEDAETPIPGDLNILARFKGDWTGPGLNMIFRPSFGNIRRNNVLEYNVTKEVCQFLADLGDVPNRGLGKQRDVIVKAVPYTQMIKDYLNPDTGKADLPPKDAVAIHFESGLFLRSPPTDDRPKLQRGTISRLASIPHGTTINCQGFEPDLKNPGSGNPNIPKVSILPFPMLHPEDGVTFAEFFPQMNMKKSFNLRIPRSIKPGDALTEELMLDPNQMLRELNENSTKKKIIDHIHFKVDSESGQRKENTIYGGGTKNIAFLYGSGMHGETELNPGPNADAVTVTCDYWVSTIEYDVVIPAGKYSQKPAWHVIESESRKEEEASKKMVVSPAFYVYLDKDINEDTDIKLNADQIQYSQNVTLNFDEMGWPHVSVGTLSPLQPIVHPADAERLKNKEIEPIPTK